MSRGESGDIGAPEHLSAEHDLSTFDSGVPALDDWLKRRALANEDSGASRTYVVSAKGKVIGYYALATGAVTVQAATGRARRNMPDPIPVMILGRLAIDKASPSEGCRTRAAPRRRPSDSPGRGHRRHPGDSRPRDL